MNGKLVIGMPEIVEIGQKARLRADIWVDGSKKELYYEVDKEYKDYLCAGRSDAFLLSLLHFAMSSGYDVSWAAPVSERLHYQLGQIYIPVISRIRPDIAKKIELNGPISAEMVPNAGGVGTGASGGVDSFYSILKNMANKEKTFCLTHLLVLAVSNNIEDDAHIHRTFESTAARVRPIADELHLPLIKLFSNDYEFHYPNFVDCYTVRYAGTVYALQKLFTKFYFSSSLTYWDFSFLAKDDSQYSLFTLMSVSGGQLTFYSTGSEVERQEKLDYIEHHATVQKYLNVCNYNHEKNCSKCDKCMRTMSGLYADGVLSQFAECFDLELFEKNKLRYITKMLYRQTPYDKEILKRLKEKDVRFPLRARIKALATKPVHSIWQVFKHDRLIMGIFYRFNLDYKLYGKEMADSIRFSKGIPKTKQ